MRGLPRSGPVELAAICDGLGIPLLGRSIPRGEAVPSVSEARSARALFFFFFFFFSLFFLLLFFFSFFFSSLFSFSGGTVQVFCASCFFGVGTLSKVVLQGDQPENHQSSDVFPCVWFETQFLSSFYFAGADAFFSAPAFGFASLRGPDFGRMESATCRNLELLCRLTK